ncbi:Error-prone DNA polymerase, partial [Pseudomonas coronafaciens pv. garcae]
VQLLQDARRHHIEIRPVDVRYSHWDCSLEPVEHPDRTRNLAIRLGLRMLRSFREDDALRIEAARSKRSFTDATDLAQRAGLDSRAAEALADSGALRGLIGHRHRARWEVAGVEAQ